METTIRLVNASLSLEFEAGNHEEERFLQEYYTLSLVNDEPLGAWLKNSKIRKEAQECDQVLLTLLVDLHRKVDTLTRLVQDKETPLHIPLEKTATINAIGHGFFQCDQAVFEKEKVYYGRLALPSFPRRVSPLFFEAISPNLAKISLMHEEDEKEWDAYMAACERAMIRQMKGYGSEY
jgi:hypothetical protein